MTDLINIFKKNLEKANSAMELEKLRKDYFGSKGTIKQMLGEIGKLPLDQRKTRALEVQKIQLTARNLFSNKEKIVKKAGLESNLKEEAEQIDYCLPKIGHLHPLTQTVRRLNQFFTGMGYSIMEGPEIETDEYCFQKLNVPEDHPAREMQDTVYIKEPDILLRTQTSSIEARILEKYRPPFKVVCPGRVYRNEKVNKSNHFIFHHYQGVVVLKKVSLKDLFGTFTALFKKMYGPDVKIRYRNKYYPEVEPGVGPDMQCFNCGGKGEGCRVCKGVGWIEMGGAGIIHPNVLKMGGIDPKKWRGFAFGLGLDRWVMAKYNISDIRTLLGGNIGYKPYFNENTL